MGGWREEEEIEHAFGHRWEKISCNNTFTEVECVVTHGAGCVIGRCVWGSSYHMSFVCCGPAPMSGATCSSQTARCPPDASSLCQTHGALTRYWSRWRSVSGVNSEDMGMISPFLTMIALKTAKTHDQQPISEVPRFCVHSQLG